MIELLETTTSTNEVALAAAAEGAPHGTAWIADTQTAGRGRRVVGGKRREWFSPPERNIYLSVLLRPNIGAADVAGVTLAAGAYVCGALVEATGVDAWLKWPNDIWVESRKLGGILTEAVTSPSGVEAVVIGVGLNVNLGSDEVPEELADIVTSVRIATGAPADRLLIGMRVYRAVLEAAAVYFGGGWQAVRADIDRWDRSHGRDVEVERRDRWVRGVARGIAPNGALRIEIDGETIDVTSGEVRFI